MAVGRVNPSSKFRIVAVLALALFGCSAPAVMTLPEPVRRGPLHELGLQFLAAAETLHGGPGAMYEALKSLRQRGGTLPKIRYVQTFYSADGTAKQVTITTFEELERVIVETRAIHAASKEAIFRHGFPQLSARYMATVSPQCSQKWFTSGEVTVQQIDFMLELSQGQEKFWGAVVESTISVIFPGGFEPPLTGELREGYLGLWGRGPCIMRLDPR